MTQRCRICGCTNLAPCMTSRGTCSWSEADLCSVCWPSRNKGPSKLLNPINSLKDPWRLVRHPPYKGIEEEWSVIEGVTIVGAFDRKFYAELTMAARLILDELAAAEKKEISDLVQEILERNK